MTILNLNEAPADPAARLTWMSGLNAAIERELDAAYAATYAQLRREGRLEWAIKQGLHGKKRILALTRKWNREQGQMVRWGDGADPTSSAYRLR